MGFDLELWGYNGDSGAISLIVYNGFRMNIVDHSSGRHEYVPITKVDFIPKHLLEVPITDSTKELLHFLLKSKVAATSDVESTCMLIKPSKHRAVKSDHFCCAVKFGRSHILQILLDEDSATFPRDNPAFSDWALCEKGKSMFGQILYDSIVMALRNQLNGPSSKDQTPTLVKRFASLSVSGDGDTTSTASEAKPPNLDTLPNELLDKIFEESLELNMTLTSTRIAAKISSRRRLARSLTLLSFCRSDVANNLNLNPVPICGALGLSHPLTEDDRRVLQEHVLNGDWLTVNMLKLAMGEIHEAYIQKHWVDAGIETKPSYMRAFEERWLASNGVMERKLELCGVDAFREDTSFVIEDPFVVELNSVEELDSDQYDAFGVLQVVVVSDRLLAPPITDSKLELLYFLWRSQSATARWQMTFSESVMRQAVQDAISTGQLDYTCLLVDIRSHSTPDGSSSSVKAEDFLTAAKYNQARILQILLEFDSRDFPRNDPSMKHWARAARNKGDGFGAIVLVFMRARNVQPGRHCFSTFLFRSGYVPYNFPLWNAVPDMINLLGERFGV
ncbi:hypothetical protein GJ744_008687 [Endocarpon pusillum]|uniref:Uncharacterized protein n=1 Tax=Endocarpon pusillum TaxID=364733 RepID=A0A8H7E512_9EURO|nr:hypothetical protein GJ744_008687 [Endocarpon pusillum]